jgi:hypothetical protein
MVSDVSFATADVSFKVNLTCCGKPDMLKASCILEPVLLLLTLLFKVQKKKYADVCWRMLTYAQLLLLTLSHSHTLLTLLFKVKKKTYADVCWRMLTYTQLLLLTLSHSHTLTHSHAQACTATPQSRSCRKMSKA